MAVGVDVIAEAYRVLESVREVAFPNRPVYLHPYKFLSALLYHVPSVEGKTEIAKDILAASQDDVVARLTKLSDYFFYNLVIPCTLCA